MSESQHITWHEGNVGAEDRRRLLRQKGVVLWLTGLSGAGKSTIACALEQKLLQRGKLAYRLDGDNVRFGLNKDAGLLSQQCGYDASAAKRFGIGFSAEDRRENIRRIGEAARLLADAGVIVIASFVSPYQRDRDAVRSILGRDGFVEVFVKVSLAAAERRDPKGLYRKARTGEIKGFTGIDDPYEAPQRPELLLDTEVLSAEGAAEALMTYLEEHNYLRA